MDKVRIGVVGIGNMGSSHCRQLFEGKIQKAELVAVCDIKEERRKWAKETFTGVKVYSSIDEIIESRICDALIIATPHYDHPGMGIQALQEKLHVLVEKPIGVYTKAVEELNQVAMESDQVFTIMYNQRTNPVYQKVRDLVKLGEIGELIRVNWTITNWFRSEKYYTSGGWRATWEGEGGGVLLNQCPHQIDLIQWICGMPTKVRGFAKYGQYHNIEVEDDVTAYFEYPNGATGVFISSTGEAPGTNRLEISGTKGKLIVEENKIIFYRNEVDCTEFSKTSLKAFDRPEVWKCEIPVISDATEHIGIMQSFTDAIIDGEKQLAPGIEGINGLSLSNAIHMSSWTDEWVEFPIDSNRFYDLLQEKIKNSVYSKKVDESVLDLSGSH